MRQLLRYGTVGASNTLLTLVVFAGLTHLGVTAGPASALAFTVGAANGYVLNRAWTFRSPARFHRYVAVQALGAGCSAVAITLLAALPHLGAEALVMPPVTLLTFVLSRTVVFGHDYSAPRRASVGDRRAARSAG